MSYDEEKLTTLGHLKELAKRVEQDYATKEELKALEEGGGGEAGGTSDHRELANRDAEAQHPIGAITGLEMELSKRLTEDSAMSVVDIIKIMEE